MYRIFLLTAVIPLLGWCPCSCPVEEMPSRISLLQIEAEPIQEEQPSHFRTESANAKSYEFIGKRFEIVRPFLVRDIVWNYSNAKEDMAFAKWITTLFPQAVLTPLSQINQTTVSQVNQSMGLLKNGNPAYLLMVPGMGPQEVDKRLSTPAGS